MKVVSFFAGCGGLDLGFEQAGYDVVWANEFDPTIHPTYRLNHPNTYLDGRDIRNLNPDDIPDCDGFIGGPPCQSWSVAGKMLGLDDERGQVFLDYIRLISNKKPKFFVIENVAGIISDKHFTTFQSFISALSSAGYKVSYSVLNVADFGVPQERERIFVVGIRNDIDVNFEFPLPKNTCRVSLQQSIGDISKPPRSFSSNDIIDTDSEIFHNNDYYVGLFDYRYMARNRVRAWNEVSFTIPATASKVPLHPQAPKMEYVDSDHRRFVKGKEHLYRRLSVRECARIQSFPDSFIFIYTNIIDGYKMVGNAVPPQIGKLLAESLSTTFSKVLQKDVRKESVEILVGYYKNDKQYQETLRNRLYYVRTGFRLGAMRWTSGTLAPQYLLLHHGSERHLYMLKRQEPILKTAQELRQMGFCPQGDVYLCFEILDDVDRIAIIQGFETNDLSKAPCIIKQYS